MQFELSLEFDRGNGVRWFQEPPIEGGDLQQLSEVLEMNVNFKPMFLFAIVSVLLLSGAHGALAQNFPQKQMVQSYKIDSATEGIGTLSWFDSQDHGTRGMDYNPLTNHLLVADRISATTDTVHVLDADTGAELGAFNTEGVDGGIFRINKVGVADDGKVFVANLALIRDATEQMFRLYSYPNEAAALISAPDIAYASDEVFARFGDDMTVTGSGSDTKILVASRNTSYVLLLTDPEGDGTFAAEIKDCTGIQYASNVDFGTDASTFWFHNSYAGAARGPNFDLKHYDLNDCGTPFETFSTDLNYRTGPFDFEPWLDTELIALGPAEVLFDEVKTDVRGVVYRRDFPIAPWFWTSGLERTGEFMTNGNGGGDVVFDIANNRVFFLVTNNSISCWEFPETSGAQGWENYR